MAVIVEGVRTPVGRFGGILKDFQAYELGSIVVRGLLKKLAIKPVPTRESLEFYPSKLPKGKIELEKAFDYDGVEVPIDEVIFGNVLQAAQGQNPARQALIYAGIPKEVPAFTVNKVCASGLKAVALAAQSIDSGNAKFAIAGGMESMSNAPYALRKARWGYRMSVNAFDEILDLMVFDGLWEKFYGYHMGFTAENIAGRGLLLAFEVIDRLGVLRDTEIVLYDVPGDVVCGGFVVPMKRDSEVYIVTSGEYLSIYAANNICNGARNSGTRVGGLILNSKFDLELERRIVEEFAEAVGTELVGEIPYLKRLKECEISGKTVFQLSGTDYEAGIFSSIAQRILKSRPSRKVEGLEDEELIEIFGKFYSSSFSQTQNSQKE